MQQSNFLGNQPNLVGYQAAEQNSFSGEPFYCMRFLSNTIVIINCLAGPDNLMSDLGINSWGLFRTH